MIARIAGLQKILTKSGFCCVITTYVWFHLSIMYIHNRIALFRAESGLSRKALAEAVGVNVQTIGYLERGDYNPSLELAMKLADRFGVAIEHLFSFTPFPSVADVLRRAGDS